MPAARYTIQVPAQDELGQSLRIHPAVHQHLNETGWENPVIQPGYPFHSVSAWAEETPEADSSAKQVGAYVGELANHPAVQVTKDAAQPASWQIGNQLYRPGEGAENGAVLNEPNIDTILMNQPQIEDNMLDPYGRSNPTNPEATNPLHILTSIHAGLSQQRIDN